MNINGDGAPTSPSGNDQPVSSGPAPFPWGVVCYGTPSLQVWSVFVFVVRPFVRALSLQWCSGFVARRLQDGRWTPPLRSAVRISFDSGPCSDAAGSIPPSRKCAALLPYGPPPQCRSYSTGLRSKKRAVAPGGGPMNRWNRSPDRIVRALRRLASISSCRPRRSLLQSVIDQAAG